MHHQDATMCVHRVHHNCHVNIRCIAALRNAELIVLLGGSADRATHDERLYGSQRRCHAHQEHVYIRYMDEKKLCVQRIHHDGAVLIWSMCILLIFMM